MSKQERQKAVTLRVAMGNDKWEYVTIAPGDTGEVNITTDFTNNFTGKPCGSFVQTVKVYVVEDNEKYLDTLIEDFED